MGKLVWKGWQKSAENAPQPSSVIYAANIRSSKSETTSNDALVEVDYVVELLRKTNLPLTRENYFGLAYPEGVPDDLDETSLPGQIRNC